MFSLESLKGRNIIVHDAEIIRLVGSPHPTENRPLTWNDHDVMGISVVCTFEYADMEYHVYMKDNLDKFIEKMNRAELITGFNVIGFDHKLYRGSGLPLKPESELPTYDMLVESRKALGWEEGSQNFPKGCRLDNHLRGTFGDGFMKTANGEEAPQMWQEGRLGELISYCLGDAHRERTLFEFICKHGFVITDTHGAKTVRHPFQSEIKFAVEPEQKPNFAAGSPEWIEEVFTYHAPTVEQQANYLRIRENAKSFAKVLIDNTPPCADRNAAIRKLRETVQTANAAIALKGLV